MATWLGEIKCLKCGLWQIPMAYCPRCGYKWVLVEMPPQAPDLADLDAFDRWIEADSVVAVYFSSSWDGSTLDAEGHIQ